LTPPRPFYKDVRKKGVVVTLAKLTSKDQLTLRPLSAVHEKMEQLNITEADIGKAVAWSQ
jgi:hypothetical protein